MAGRPDWLQHCDTDGLAVLQEELALVGIMGAMDDISDAVSPSVGAPMADEGAGSTSSPAHTFAWQHQKSALAL